MRIVISGVGKVGSAVARQLSAEGHDVTVIDKDPKALEEVISTLDITGYVGRGYDRAILEQASANGMDLFISLTGNDEMNLLSCLVARKMGAYKTIARVSQPDFSDILPVIADDLHLSLYVNSDDAAAQDIMRIIAQPNAKKVETFASGRAEMIEYALEPDNPLRGRLVKDVFANTRSALVCMVQRGEDFFVPGGDFRMEAGDVLTITAPRGKLYRFFRESGIHQKRIKRIIISGGGRITYYLARRLLVQRYRVTIIENNEQVAKRLAELLPDAEVCLGDGTNQAVLLDKGLETADAFCCLTGIDEENILAVLYAHTINAKVKTVTKINRDELIPVVKPLGIGSVVTSKQLVADHIVSYVRAQKNRQGTGVLAMYKMGDGKVEALEFEVSVHSKLIGRPIRSLNLKKNLLLAAINRQGIILSPRGDDELKAGDTVVVVTTDSGFTALDDILEGTHE